MSKAFINAIKQQNSLTYTENGATTYATTGSKLYDMFAMGGAMRQREAYEIREMFCDAYFENPLYALKCLFYLRDREAGQGERRFFRTCYSALIKYDIEAARRNLEHIPTYGRWDDLIYITHNTPLWHDAIKIIKAQLEQDMAICVNSPNGAISLLAKWLPSENTSSRTTRAIGNKVCDSLKMTHRQYRKTLSVLRGRIGVLEKLMSENRWDEIDFSKIPSRAGLIYQDAFMRHLSEKYQAFANDKNTKVNAKVLYPYEVVNKALNHLFLDEVNMVNKYWDNLQDYFNGKTFNGIAVVDTSGSMCGPGATAPINVAISLGLYCAEKNSGPFANHYISFSSRPQLVEIKGQNFVEKVNNIYRNSIIDNTNIEAVFDLLLNTAINNNCTQADIPQNIIILSDMEFDAAQHDIWHPELNSKSLMEEIETRWSCAGYKIPNLIFWNVDARNDNIPMTTRDGITFVSGMSPVIYEMVLSGKTGEELMFDKLNSERYQIIN